MKPGATVRALSLCALLSAAVPAYPTPFSVVNTPTSGERGTAFTSVLFDADVEMLEAADILLTFDSDFFDYLGSTVGSATSGFSLLAGNPLSVGGSLLQLEISLATAGAPVEGIAGSLVDVSFLIKPNAPLGDSVLVFQSLPLSDYDIPMTSGTMTVTQAVAVPEPDSSLLVGLAMLALGGFRRRWRWQTAWRRAVDDRLASCRSSCWRSRLTTAAPSGYARRT
ncbi:MAG TPA: hypothetical protein PK752_19585 [Accumulibacter sp.]|uniref:PEP-CTERM sorting domain-containing protein n=1 Tax=Accumulibacter sp. TaxID=2053492 RepID=UPI002CF21417|nr:PEP-CTERM sorting domain-containing protein [Accumulibacter sp.]HRD90433.1 hypothetical protein [Accumulibacter sp.]